MPLEKSMKRETSYESWIRQEGIPIAEGFGVEDVRGLLRAPWPRTGGRGAFIQLRGLEGFTGVGHSVEDCLYTARSGFEDHIRTLHELGLPVPPPCPNPTVVIQNERKPQAV